jgi:flagellar motor protein MotB
MAWKLLCSRHQFQTFGARGMEVQDFVYLVAILFVLMLFMSSLSTGRRRRRKRRASSIAPQMAAVEQGSVEAADSPTEIGAAVQAEDGVPEASSSGDDGDTTVPSSTA